MSWIKTVSQEQAAGSLRELYARVAGPSGTVDNVLQIHSLRPHTLEGHMALYKSVLHHGGNKLPKWLLETIGLYVSFLNGCIYCVAHHFAGLGRVLQMRNARARFATRWRAAIWKKPFPKRVSARFLTTRDD